MTPKRFHDDMATFLDEYRDHLLLVKPNETAISPCSIINEFINYLYRDHLISGFDQITVSIVNSKFNSKYNRLNKDVISKQTMKNILKGFFTFLHGKHGIKNEKLMRGLEK
jgi:hypothetical protein